MANLRRLALLALAVSFIVLFRGSVATAGGPDDKSAILPVYIYRTALFDGQMGLGAAISLLMLVINLVVALVYLRLLRERRSERTA